MNKVIEFLKRVFLSKAACIVYLVAIIFGYVGAVIGAIAIPIDDKCGWMIAALLPAVGVAGPLYYKAFRWCLTKAMEE